MDSIFKALADPARRALLDSLRRKDGQTLQELEPQLEMTRFGVMKHLGVLEEAGLVVTRRQGRFKYHYLNALPLQEAIDRWIEPLLVKQAARAVLSMKTILEGHDQMTKKPDFLMQTYIRCSQDSLWDALTDETNIAHYHFLPVQASSRDGTVRLTLPDGSVLMSSRLLAMTPKSRLECTFEPNWDGGGGPSRIVYLIAPEGTHCKLTVEHYDLTVPAVSGEGIADGWARWAAGLKTWLETGQDARFGAAGAA